jgi:hypothetical protein
MQLFMTYIKKNLTASSIYLPSPRVKKGFTGNNGVNESWSDVGLHAKLTARSGQNDRHLPQSRKERRRKHAAELLRQPCTSGRRTAMSPLWVMYLTQGKLGY